MKKRIFLAIIMTLMLALVLAFAVSADSVHSGKVDLNKKVTLSDGTECALFDADGNALIWYKDNTGAIKSIRADMGITGNDKVDYKVTGWSGGTIHGVQCYQIDDVFITVNDVTYDDKSIVVFNIMDDDVVVTSSTKGDHLLGKPVNCMQCLFNNSGNILEYVFLRLDTVAIQGDAFMGSDKLKYVNFEDLYMLNQFAGRAFMNCSSLGPNLVLPNSVITIGTACFNGCSSLTTARLGESVSDCGSYDFFMNCKNLTTLYIPGTLTNIKINSFKNSPNITTVFYTGGIDEANAFMTSANNSGGNDYVTSLTMISNADYNELSVKTGKYFVYGYSVCDAFNNGNHQAGESQYVFTSVIENSFDQGVCTICAQTSTLATYTPIMNFVGYSAKINGDRICVTYTIDNKMLAVYEAKTSKTLQLGVTAAIVADGVTQYQTVNSDLTPVNDKTVVAEIDSGYAGFDFILSGFTSDYYETNLVMCAYVYDGETVYYIDNGGCNEYATPFTFNSEAE